MAETETPLGGWAVSHADAGPDGEDDKGGWAAREERQGEVAPEFEPRHETKFRKTDFHPSPFRMVGAGILLKHMFEGGALYWDSEGPAGRPHQRLSPQVTLWLAGFGVAVGMNLLLSLPRFSRRLREHISQHKSVLFTSFLLLLLSLTILHLVAVEHSRALVIFAAPDGGTTACPPRSSIPSPLTIDHSRGFPPTRSCAAQCLPVPLHGAPPAAGRGGGGGAADERQCPSEAPRAALAPGWSHVGMEDACDSRLGSWYAVAQFCAYLVMMRPLELAPGAALLVSVLSLLLIGLGALAVGSSTSEMLSIVSIPGITCLCATLSCFRRLQLARGVFVRALMVKHRIDRCSELLATLIPAGVMARLREAPPGEMVAGEVKHCAVMFCSLDPSSLGFDSNEKEFQSLNQVFSALDKHVEESLMYKYHHIANSYVVTCPHAASPFGNPEEHDAAACIERIIELGCTLINKVHEFKTASGGTIRLKVGVHCGPATAAVVGRHKRFFCLFGDVINTAARMCSHGERERVHCSEAVVQALSQHHAISVFPRGAMAVKGKGFMKTFFVWKTGVTGDQGDLKTFEDQMIQGIQKDTDTTVFFRLESSEDLAAYQRHAEEAHAEEGSHRDETSDYPASPVLARRMHRISSEPTDLCLARPDASPAGDESAESSGCRAPPAVRATMSLGARRGFGYRKIQETGNGGADQKLPRTLSVESGRDAVSDPSRVELSPGEYSPLAKQKMALERRSPRRLSSLWDTPPLLSIGKQVASPKATTEAPEICLRTLSTGLRESRAPSACSFRSRTSSIAEDEVDVAPADECTEAEFGRRTLVALEDLADGPDRAETSSSGWTQGKAWDLGKETRQKSPIRGVVRTHGNNSRKGAWRMSATWATFEKPQVEALFQAHVLVPQCRRIAVGLLGDLHAAAIAFHAGLRLQHVNSPAPTIAHSVFFWASAVLICLKLAAFRTAGLSTFNGGNGALQWNTIMGLKVLQLVLGAVSAPFTGALVWSVLFVTIMNWTMLYFAGAPLRAQAVFVPASVALLAVAVGCAMPPMVAGVFTLGFATAGALFFLLSRDAHFLERTQWRAVELLLVEGRQVGRMLEDLLPRAVADEIVSSGAHNCHNLHVVILQLDLRGYTGLAMSMTSTELAAVIHSLFSEFDDEVVARKVFKMDTIGDCYIVLAVIPPEGQGPARGSARATCVKMRFLAEKMIAIVSRPRGTREKPLRLSCRVGIAVGHVVAGVIGRLQPRYHCVGKVMEEVMRLEGGSMINAVNLSLEVAEMLEGASLSRTNSNDSFTSSTASLDIYTDGGDLESRLFRAQRRHSLLWKGLQDVRSFSQSFPDMSSPPREMPDRLPSNSSQQSSPPGMTSPTGLGQDEWDHRRDLAGGWDQRQELGSHQRGELSSFLLWDPATQLPSLDSDQGPSGDPRRGETIQRRGRELASLEWGQSFGRSTGGSTGGSVGWGQSSGALSCEGYPMTRWALGGSVSSSSTVDDTGPGSRGSPIAKSHRAKGALVDFRAGERDAARDAIAADSWNRNRWRENQKAFDDSFSSVGPTREVYLSSLPARPVRHRSRSHSTHSNSPTRSISPKRGMDAGVASPLSASFSGRVEGSLPEGTGRQLRPFTLWKSQPALQGEDKAEPGTSWEVAAQRDAPGSG